MRPLTVATVVVAIATFGVLPEPAEAGCWSWNCIKRGVTRTVKAPFKIIEKIATEGEKTVRKTLNATGRTLEAGGRLVTGDTEGAKESINKAGANLQGAVTAAGNAAIASTLAPVLATAPAVDTLLGTDGDVESRAHAVQTAAEEAHVSTVETATQVLNAAGRTVEAGAHLVTGDTQGAEKSINKAGNNLEAAGTSLLHATIGAPADMAFHLHTGVDPDDVRSEITRMLAQCRQVENTLPDSPSYTQAFSGEIHDVDDFVFRVATAPVVLFVAIAQDELKKDYETAVATCTNAYETARKAHIDAIDEETRSREEKRRVLASMADAVKSDIQDISNVIMDALETTLDRRITEVELWDVAAEHPEAVGGHLLAAQDVLDLAIRELNCYSAIHRDEELLDRFGEETAAALCQ